MIALSRRFESDEIRDIRRRAIFEAGKFDPQTYDEPTLAPFAIRIAPSAWAELATLAERSAAEIREVERVLRAERRHWSALGIPSVVRAIIGAARAAGARDARFCRFDFHPTTEGWRASEINADVPGGFIEAGAVTRIVAERFAGLACPPDPARELAAAIARRVRDADIGGGVALVHATSYADDQQVMRRIAAELAELGVASHLASPVHLSDRRDGCVLATNGARIAAAARFFPGEWLGNMRRVDRARWARTTATVAQTNPVSALLVQGKRLPLVARALGLRLEAWSSVLPETLSIGLRRFAPTLVPRDLVLKPVWGRIGEGVAIEGVTARADAMRAHAWARAFPKSWVLQRRFTSIPIGERGMLEPAKAGDGVHACFGVYVIDGRAAGIYARVARKPLIDGRAQDAAVLIDPSLEPASEHKAPHASRASRLRTPGVEAHKPNGAAA